MLHSIILLFYFDFLCFLLFCFVAGITVSLCCCSCSFVKKHFAYLWIIVIISIVINYCLLFACIFIVIVVSVTVTVTDAVTDAVVVIAIVVLIIKLLTVVAHK